MSQANFRYSTLLFVTYVSNKSNHFSKWFKYNIFKDDLLYKTVHTIRLLYSLYSLKYVFFMKGPRHTENQLSLKSDWLYVNRKPTKF